ncbi:MAG TPA: hypothetical protein VFO62_10625 [Candidatus Binatia bacterium]|nr:hypothetical protein [Candidatus Binatia bacterium]
MKPAAILLIAILAAGYLLGAYAIAVMFAALVAWAAYGYRVEREFTPRYVTGETLLARDRQTRERRKAVERWQR